MGTKTLELRPSTVDKSTAVRSILKDLSVLGDGRGLEVDFLLCIGDGKTDEVVFQSVQELYPENALTCTVGKKQTEAQFYIDSVKDVQAILSALSREES